MAEPRVPMSRIAVVGAGLMGAAIASVFASSQHPVAVQDPDRAALDRIPGELARIAGLRGEAAPDEAAVRRSVDLAEVVYDADLVVEAAPERAELKKAIFARLGELTAPDTVLATNTSSIPVGVLAAATTFPRRVLATHFWNPPYAVRLVEVVQAEQTDIAVVKRVLELLRGARMHPVHIKRDVPGVVGNRLQHALKREAIAIVAAGVCDAETLDTVVKLGFGSRMAVLGPLEQSDLVGLDLTLAIHETLMPDLDVTPAPHPYLVAKVAGGETGMAAGRGFREWSPQEARVVHDRLDAYLAEAAHESG